MWRSQLDGARPETHIEPATLRAAACAAAPIRRPFAPRSCRRDDSRPRGPRCCPEHAVVARGGRCARGVPMSVTRVLAIARDRIPRQSSRTADRNVSSRSAIRSDGRRLQQCKTIASNSKTDGACRSAGGSRTVTHRSLLRLRSLARLVTRRRHVPYRSTPAIRPQRRSSADRATIRAEHRRDASVQTPAHYVSPPRRRLRYGARTLAQAYDCRRNRSGNIVLVGDAATMNRRYAE